MKKWIIPSTLIACTLLYFVEQGLEVNYGWKTAAKWIFFLAMPLLLSRFFNREKQKKAFHKRGIFLGLLFGGISFASILVAYFLLQDVIDFDSIVQELKKSGISAENFIFIALYITVGNSLLEEFFFRGFIFLNLYQAGSRTLAYLYSALLFATYHISIFQSWFSWELILLALFGLFTIGLVFNWLDTKTNTFLNSWVVHIMADLAIVLIGFHLFGIF